MLAERHSRYDRKPVVGETGKIVSAIITPRREKILKFLLRNRYASHADILAYLGGNGEALYYSLRCQIACNRDPSIASNSDPLAA